MHFTKKDKFGSKKDLVNAPIFKILSINKILFIFEYRFLFYCFLRSIMRIHLVFKLACLMVVFCYAVQKANAQARFRPSYYDLSSFKISPLPKRFLYAGVSANAYRGDVSNNYKKWTPAIHAGILWNRKKLLNGGISLTAGRLIGDDLSNFLATDLEAPNTYFSTQFFSISYDLRLSLVKRKNFMFYLRQGIGLFRFEPYDRAGKKLLEQRNTRIPEESYSTISTFFPTGAGFVLVADNGMGIGLDLGWMHPNTDYLDNVSQASKRTTNDNVITWQLRSYFPLKDKPKKTKRNAKNNQKTSLKQKTAPAK
jgi:hypothetical protein